MMKVIYSSENYYVVEYPDERAYELVDKWGARTRFFQGEVAARFMACMRSAVAEDASFEHLDGFLGGFDALLDQPVVVH
jgi:uncharacterized protein DUF3567